MANILILNRIYPPRFGTSGRLLRDLCRALLKANHTVRIITASADDGSVHSTQQLQVIKLPDTQTPTAYSNARLLLRMLQTGKKMADVDLIITLADPPFSFGVGQILAKKLKAKHIHWCHDVYPELISLHYPWLPRTLLKPLVWLGRSAMGRADAVVAISHCMAKYLQRTSFKGMNLTCIPHWPDPALKNTKTLDTEFDSDREDDSQLHNSTSHTSRFQVLYTGSLNELHPMATVLDAAAFLAQKDPDVLFTFVGRGSGFKNLIAKRGQRMLENVRLLPPQPLQGQRSLLESGDVHLAVESDDAVGLMLPAKALNAALVEKPLIFIGPNGSDLAQKCSVHIKHGDVNALVDAIVLFKADAEKAKYAGKILAEQFADQSAHTQLVKWLNLVDEVCSQNNKLV